MFVSRVSWNEKASPQDITQRLDSSRGDSALLGCRDHEVAIARGNRILAELAKRERSRQEGTSASGPWLDPEPSVDVSQLLPHTAAERTAGVGGIQMLTFYEFFAGGGMARAGLGDRWGCVFANDFDKMKVSTYRDNWGDDHLVCCDVATLNICDLPGTADLSWASFPCQDLSLAGDYRGLGHAASPIQTRSGTFWPFWSLMRQLVLDDRAPRLIVLENVYGALTSHKGRDFAAICSSLSESGYRFGAVVINAQLFLPQSRPRVFFIAIRCNEHIPSELIGGHPRSPWHPATMIAAYDGLSPETQAKWIWWNIQLPALRNTAFVDHLEETPSGVDWHTPSETEHILEMMSSINKDKVAAAMKAKRRIVGCVYRRTRPDETGVKRQRAEVRFDDIAGCLRTPAGGSSRQTLLIIENGTVRSRLLSPREAARLMGLHDGYKLPTRYNDAYHVAGDGVCVPVVRFLADTILEPIIEANMLQTGAIAA